MPAGLSSLLGTQPSQKKKSIAQFLNYILYIQSCKAMRRLLPEVTCTSPWSWNTTWHLMLTTNLVVTCTRRICHNENSTWNLAKTSVLSVPSTWNLAHETLQKHQCFLYSQESTMAFLWLLTSLYQPSGIRQMRYCLKSMNNAHLSTDLQLSAAKHPHHWACH